MKKLIAGLSLLFLVSGCLETEYTDVTWYRSEGEPSIIIADAINIYSDETDPVKIKQDFDRLMDVCRKENHEGAQGFVLQGCKVQIDEGKIVLRLIERLDHLPAGDISVSDTEIVWKLNQSDGEIVETNAKIAKTGDDVFLRWPKDAPELHVKTRNSRPGSNAQAPLLELFRDYISAETLCPNRLE
jgi:hypothetical protein